MLKSGGRYNTVKRSPRWIRSESFDSKRQSDHTDLHVYNQKGGNSLCPSQPNCFRFMTLMSPEEHNSKGWFSRNLNQHSDWAPRHFSDSSSWLMNPIVFKTCLEWQCTAIVDLFADRTNAQFPTYMSWFSDPDAIATTLEGGQGYAFPLFVWLHVVSRKFG